MAGKWLSALSLRKIFSGNHITIAKALQDVMPDMPYAIQIKRKFPHLNEDYINEFAERSGLKRHNKLIKTKTDKWLSVNEARVKYITGKSKPIRDKFQELYLEHPEMLQFKRNGTHNSLCLHVDYVEKFCELSGLRSVRSLAKKQTTQWLTIPTLINMLDIGTLRLTRLLNQSKDVMPYAVQYRTNLKNNVVLCLNKKYINEFCARNNITMRAPKHETKNVDAKPTHDWLNVYELTQYYIIGDALRVREELKQYQDAMPDMIKYQCKVKQQHIKLHRDGIKYFCELTGMHLRSEKAGPKTSEWFSVNDLTHCGVIGRYKKISDALVQLKPQMPKKIVYKRDAKGKIIICVHRDSVKQFCEMAGLNVHNDILDMALMNKIIRVR